MIDRDVSGTTTLLNAAAATFARLGYRRTTMDAVARAAGCSRQLLYLKYESKERLFQATVTHALGSQLADAAAALKARGSLATRVAAALAAWLGPHAISSARDAGELTEATRQLSIAIVSELETAFLALLEAALGSEPPSRRKAQARLLLFASHEIKRRSASLKEMHTDILAAVRALPLTELTEVEHD